MLRRLFPVTWLLPLVMLSACTTRQIPDLGPFAKSTSTMKSSVSSSFQEPIHSARVMAAELKEAADRGGPAAVTAGSQAADYATIAKALKERQAYFDKAIGVFVEYSRELQSIADKGRDEVARAEAYSAAIKGLVSSAASLTPVPAATPIAAGVGAVVDVAKSIREAVIRERVRKSLLEEVTAHTTDVDDLAAALQKDLGTVRETLATRAEAARAAYELEYFEATNFNNLVQAYRGMVAAKLGSSIQAALDPEQRQAVSSGLVGQAIDADRLAQMGAHMMEPVTSGVNSHQEILSRAVSVLDETIELVGSWRTAHAKLPETINEGRVSELEALADAAQQTATLVTALKKSIHDIREPPQ